ncbi:glyoxal oxidase [Russula earlei]|uniref:Glyoxal oxidase n=1 Tax=Russula earlei TaxID=71964 RepID=A0ACC0UD10_9AGAM|nr:glyoxal oxidase [Russula earlei]
MLTWLLRSSLALGLVFVPVFAQQPGSFLVVGDTLASAMMMFVGSPNKVHIIDKVEANAHQINGHAVYASVWDLDSRTATPIDTVTNAFCAAGMHLPNASYAVFGGNAGIGPGGTNTGPGSTPAFDPTYQDYDGRQAIRMITSCTGNVNAAPCNWYDQPNGLRMIKRRWYPGAEALADGTIVLIGGFTQGGFINRNYPNVDPAYEGGQAEPTYEFFPPRTQPPQVMNFMIKTSGLNGYALAFLMASGKMFVQANYSTCLWDYNNNIETPLPDMPGQVVRVYPASGASTMLPLTPYNGYNPTILFCGGQSMPDADWGDYGYPHVDTWTVPASSDCQRITPEPADGSAPAYVQDDDLPVGRTLSQFIALPDGTLLLLNGAQNGTAGYAIRTLDVLSLNQMPFGMSLASGPVLQPAIYNPNAPAGNRWSTAGLGSSNIPRMYHSTAILLPDGSVMVAGSNPNADVDLTTVFPTTYTAEYFYPPYFSAKIRPAPQNIPTTLSYGGNPFDITVPPSSYTGDPNVAASNTTVWLIRQGFTTHGMNMGQRSMQLNNTFTVNADGTILLHTAQLPPNPNLFQPGPAFLWVTIAGIPSNGTFVMVGSGQIGPQPTSPASVLPASVRSGGSGNNATTTNNGTTNGSKSNGASPCDGTAGHVLVSLVVAAVTLALS